MAERDSFDASRVSQTWDWDAVRRWCFAIACRHVEVDVAHDIAQEAALRAWRKRDTCRSPEHPWPWLAAITRREVARHRSAEGPAWVAFDDEHDSAAWDPVLEGTPDRISVWQAVGALSQRDRDIILLHYGADLTVAAVASSLEVPQGTVKVTLGRIRDKLRSRLLT